MKSVTVGGIKITPKWEWSKEYKANVREHAKQLDSKLPSKHSISIVAEHDKHRYGEHFRTQDMQQLAETMVKYALWIVERDSLSLTTHKLVVNLIEGTVRFTVHPDCEGYTVRIPNHDWQPYVLDMSDNLKMAA